MIKKVVPPKKRNRRSRQHSRVTKQDQTTELTALFAQNSTLASVLNQRLREAGFMLLIAASLYFLIALWTYAPSDPGWSKISHPPHIHNAGGLFGAWLADFFLSLFGVAAYLLPILLSYGNWLWINVAKREAKPRRRGLLAFRLLGGLLIVASSTALASFYVWSKHSYFPFAPGGIIGVLIRQGCVHFLNPFGASLLLSVALLIGMTFLFGISWLNSVDLVGQWILAVFAFLSEKAQNLLSAGSSEENNFSPDELPQHAELPETPSMNFLEKTSEIFNAFITKFKSSRGKNSEKNNSNDDCSEKDRNECEREREPNPYVLDDEDIEWGFSKPGSADPQKMIAPSVAYAPKAKPMLSPKPISSAMTVPAPISAPAAPMPKPRLNGTGTGTGIGTGSIMNPIASGLNAQQTGPSLELLDPPSIVQHEQYSADDLIALSREVEARLNEFQVKADVVSVNPGPVVTRFELALAPGMKVSKVTGLVKDLARSLSVFSVRIVEVIPGKSVIGLEIPNKNREMVSIREVFASDAFQDALSPLRLALGKDIAGYPVVVDLAKMPHLLVAGTTGSGKSVGLNAMILSLLYAASPDEVRIIMIDPKMLELSIYQGIPHLLAPVVTDMKEAANALRWCVAEMDRRYKVMAALGVRNLAGFNTKIQEAEAQGAPIVDPFTPNMEGAAPKLLQTMPNVVVVIDEFADMMMVVGKKVEELIARIAQKARAAGIHMILATQRPSVDVITGLIKSNIPTRMAFQVSSKIDSRTILDQQGAEQLLGHGDMLYLPPGTALPVRVHGAFVADHEVHKTVDVWKQLGTPEYVNDILDFANTESADPVLMGDCTEGDELGDAELDPLYDKAVDIIVRSRRASVSMLQRRLKIGFNRAARILESMELAGIVSAMEGNGLRQVLIPEPIE